MEHTELRNNYISNIFMSKCIQPTKHDMIHTVLWGFCERACERVILQEKTDNVFYIVPMHVSDNTYHCRCIIDDENISLYFNDKLIKEISWNALIAMYKSALTINLKSTGEILSIYDYLVSTWSKCDNMEKAVTRYNAKILGNESCVPDKFLEYITCKGFMLNDHLENTYSKHVDGTTYMITYDDDFLICQTIDKMMETTNRVSRNMAEQITCGKMYDMIVKEKSKNDEDEN